jgi:hypothetical protein
MKYIVAGMKSLSKWRVLLKPAAGDRADAFPRELPRPALLHSGH